ncbi:MAG: excinuclease ABC subunit A [Gammaproteobacteria bacterium]|nr:MAG: excinuclease ABC subunit A [Gammaproteobacteria bacterium]TND02645.1 MAG: excinuclease ABC subunit A [Gammaproteobacteria bacterium]
MDTIHIRGARTHNLKNINLDLPRDKLIVITGLSGSGKSSLAFDTIYAEGQRRYVESLSSYARQFLSIMEKPDVDSIEGLSPAISIEQKTTSHNPRSTVGTVTEIYDYLRLLFARAGEPRCPEHGIVLEAQTVSQMVDLIMTQPEGTRLMLLAPVVQGRKGEHVQVLNELKAQGYVRARIDGAVVELEAAPALDLRKAHTIEVIVDRFKVRPDLPQRLADSLETTLRLAGGIARIGFMDEPDKRELVFSANYACSVCGYSISELEPRLFSFNNPAGACPTCDGLGAEQVFDPARVAPHPELSLAAGAVRGWDRRNVWYFQLLTSLAKHYGFNIDTPFGELPADIRKVVLYGSGAEVIAFQYLGERGGSHKRSHTFEGIIPNMERRYRETESSVVRDELAKYLATRACPECNATRLRREARHVYIAGRTLPEITALPIGRAREFTGSLVLPGSRGEIARQILKEISQRLDFLVNVGLDYLTLERSADTLSGGETQRIRLASQIGAGLVGVMYVLDEPSIGLHQRDNERLLNTLCYLRDLGNTVIVVEHDEEAILAADHVVDIGPGAGVHGGQIVAMGKPADILANENSLTGQYLSGAQAIEIPPQRTAPHADQQLRIRGASGNNLKGVNVDIPVGLMTVVTGVSGSGKSTLINDTLFKHAAISLHGGNHEPAPCAEIIGLEQFDKIVDIDQSPIGRTPRSNPATYTGLFTPIRDIFAGTQEARARGYGPGRFSFNVKGGRCEACTGDGVIKVEMHFLADIYVPCDVCKGKRYNRETLEVRFKDKNIFEVLDMTVEEAREFFHAIPVVARKLDTLTDVGLSYVRLGQNATTLSGGEAQRVKLSRELSKRDTGKTLYILDEPTTGLHFHDTKQLLVVLHRLRDHGNTVVVIEHNLDVIKTADWLIDLGPEGGDKGGEIVATGTPEQIAAHPDSHTGRFLKPVLERKPGRAPATMKQARMSRAT